MTTARRTKAEAETVDTDSDHIPLLDDAIDHAPELERKTAHGSIELVQRQRSVRVLVNLPELPIYREEVLKRGLLDKLRTEYGEPPADDPERPPQKKPEGEPKEPTRDAPEGDAPAP